MMAELLIAGRSLTGSMRSHGGGGYHKASSPGSAAVAGSFLSGGLAGAVGRQVQREAVNSATGYTEHSSIGNMLYQSSLNKGGDFANQVISNIAQGNYGQVGSIKGADAQKAFTSYMGINPKPEAPETGILPCTMPTSMQLLLRAPTLRYSPWMVPPGTSSMHRIRSKKHHILPAAAK